MQEAGYSEEWRRQVKTYASPKYTIFSIVNTMFA